MSDTDQPPRWANSIPPGRTATGLFARGNKIGVGTPNARRMSELRKQILAATTEEQVTEVMKSLYAAAVGGDIAACTVWLKYTVGPPPQAIEISSGDDSVRLDVTSLTAVILGALNGHPDAKIAVAAALCANRLAQPEGNGHEPTDGD